MGKAAPRHRICLVVITMKGKLTAAERRRLETGRARWAAVNQRETDANYRGLAASIALAAEAAARRAAEPAVE